MASDQSGKELPDENKGGLYAFAGYLYQIVGVLHLAAQLPPDPSLSGQDTSAFDALIEVDCRQRQQAVQHEPFGQDAALHRLGMAGDDEVDLVQFKFSLRGAVVRIAEQGMTEIVQRFRESAKRAESVGKVVSRFVLVTNRTVTGDAKRVADASHPPLDVIDDAATLTHWETDLRTFASQFGTEPSEFQQGLDQLIGKRFREAGEGQSPLFTVFDLISAFTGSPQARRLTPDGLAKYTKGQVEARRADFTNVEPLVRRDLLRKVADATAQGGIVILYGDGGSGKTAALQAWGEEMTSPNPPHGTVFTALRTAADATAGLVQEILADWRNVDRPDPTRGQALKRMEIANPSLRPVLQIGLDALDEDTIGNRSSLRQFLHWFANDELTDGPPFRCTLVLTCRASKELDTRWIYNQSGWIDENSLVQSIHVGDYSPDEFLEAVRPRVEPGVYETLAETPLLSQRLVLTPAPSYASSLSVGRRLPGRVADDGIVEALMHPATCEAFLRLPPRIQPDVLTGQGPAMDELADKMLERFYRKVERRVGNPELSELYQRSSLIAIAKHVCGASQLHDYGPCWRVPACTGGDISRSLAQQLFREALSDGLIVGEPCVGFDCKRWKWRHSFVEQFLRRAMEG